MATVEQVEKLITLGYVPVPGTVLVIHCPVCGRESTHPDDIIAGYCGFCHAWTHGTVMPVAVRR